MSTPNIAKGTYTGAGASLDVEVGFVPDVVIIFNVTDGTPIVFWTPDMGDAKSVDVAAAAASNAAGSVAAFAGTTAASSGFSTGADNAVSAKVYVWIAMRTNYA